MSSPTGTGAKAAAVSSPPRSPPAAATASPSSPAVQNNDDTVDSDDDDGDSSLGSEYDVYSDTTSLLSSVNQYVYENGRRYHSYHAGKYFLPNDEDELDRLDLYHHVWTMCLGGELFRAPVQDPQRILDIGCGTGIWAIDVADKYPACEVIGNDLSPVQPHWVPPNVHFEVDNAELEWTYSPASFDLIHLRNMVGCFKDWDKLLERAYRALKPGGFIEIHEFSYELFSHDPPRPVKADNPLLKWWNLVIDSAAASGQPFVPAPDFIPKLERVGFEQPELQSEMWPFSPWHKNKKMKERGAYAYLSTSSSLVAYSIGLLTRFSGWAVDDVKALCKDAEAELAKKGTAYWQKACVVYAQKPLDTN